MGKNAQLPVDDLQKSIARDGFAFVRATAMRDILAQSGRLSDWNDFAASWDDLKLDTYMADRGRYRKRRHAVYAAAPAGAIIRKPHQPHYQTPDDNPPHGGIEAEFEPQMPAM